MENKNLIVQGVDFVLVLISVALSYRKPSSADINLPSCRAQRHYKMDICIYKLVIFYAALFIINSVALVRERTIPTERPPSVGEVSANFCG
jgi:hypothetical protein